jgi:hypothetical protein
MDRLIDKLDKLHNTKIYTFRSCPASEITEEVLDEIIVTSSKDSQGKGYSGTADYRYNPEMLSTIAKKNTFNFLSDESELSFKRIHSNDREYLGYVPYTYKNLIFLT